jgi:hypothetical protein
LIAFLLKLILVDEPLPEVVLSHNHENVLNIMITCWSDGPSKPSSMPSTDVWLSPLLLWLCRGEKLGGDPWIGQPAC